MSTLYETEDGRFGTKLATNSEGKVVLEIKGSKGEVEAFAPETIKEVVPYTVSVQFIEGNDARYGKPKNYSFISKEGQVQAGDIIFVDGSPNMARVTKLNTKSRQATKELKGRKVLTEDL